MSPSFTFFFFFLSCETPEGNLLLRHKAHNTEKCLTAELVAAGTSLQRQAAPEMAAGQPKHNVFYLTLASISAGATATLLGAELLFGFLVWLIA